MTGKWSYSVELRPDQGEFHAYSAEIPEAIASGPTEADALREMGLALAAAVRGRIQDGMEAPTSAAPTGATSHTVALPASLAAKVSVYSAWRAAGITKSDLARRMGRTETEVRRILDPEHGTKLDQLEETARALGGRLNIAFEGA